MKTSFCIVLLLIAFYMQGQDYFDTTRIYPHRTANQVRLAFSTPAFNFEAGINNRTSINTTIYAIKPKTLSFPVIRISLNYYYSYSKRLKNQKAIANYTGSFIGLIVMPVFYSPINGNQRETYLRAGPMWGFQYNKDFFWFRTELGAANIYAFNPNQQILTPIIYLSLGYRIYSSKIKKKGLLLG